ncbi:aromatic ring-hydroxylating oxygenase subunit alpha [Dolichospermum circinale]|uniref:aromatic ring-hydroxylating dioxygenase subunit alpha n=2 Tax=Dolichospermum circinale TaxID=109265 RepID=UPI0004092B17|nr:aromatic ring-hydroxylating dioxygenase subunit alpha [Dolichospermum circinale]MDB9473178.1 aromatic ring-hydroxylating dioxygenase subunit alpha [Dolichospermum circinale CS-537/11]MDB9479180.1 aromatic ring-hydroxylating dioxygenase subunit alpha [Dolichospermum circinale CS-537/03]
MTNADQILINNWYVVANGEDCKPGSITTASLLGVKLLLWRSDEPNSPIQVWQDYCPHRGVALSMGEIANHTLVCAYHGWRYNEAGKCVQIPAHPDMIPPANAQAKTYHCQERYGLVWVCLGNPVNDIPEFPEWDDPNYHKTYTKSYLIQASAFRVMDNSLDVSHFPFIHDGGLGDRHHAQVEDLEVKVDKDGLTMGNYQLHTSKFNNSNKDDSMVIWYSMSHPLCQYSSTEASEIRIVDLMLVTPIDEDNSVLRYLIMWNSPENLDFKTLESKLLAGYDQTIEEDIRILHSQQPTRLPLLPPKQINTQWLPQEIHVPSDKCTVAYRRWLKELGVTYGVC